MRFWAMFAAVAVLVTAPASAGPVYVTRHYDTPAGVRDPDLTAIGGARAQALAKWFKGRKLAAIYVTSLKRTQQTVAPLAAERGLTPIVYGPTPSAELLARWKAGDDAVLVVGHGNTVPDIVAGVGGERPAEIAHPDFGELWTVANGLTSRLRITP